MTRPAIAVDSDGIIFDVETRWWEWYNRSHFGPYITKEEMFRGWKMDHLHPRVYDALGQPNFFNPMNEEAFDYPNQLYWLEKLNVVADVYIVTSCCGEPVAAMDKMAWYKRLAPFLDAQNQFVCLHDKGRFIADAMVDDRLKNLIDFGQSNPASRRFYVRRTHGRNDVLPPSIFEVGGLEEVYNVYAK